MYKVLEPSNVLKTQFRIVNEAETLSDAVKSGNRIDQPGYIIVDKMNICLVDELGWDCDYSDFDNHYSYDFLGMDVSRYMEAE